MDDPALWIAVAALLFTITSFWWLNARKGRLEGYQPPAYAAAVKGDGVLLLRLPLTLYNTGARTRVVHGMRLVLDTEPPTTLRWENLRESLHPAEDDFLDFPGPLAIDGRRALQVFPQFTGYVEGGLPEARSYTAQVQTRLDGSDTWQCPVSVTLRFWHMHAPDTYITYANSDEACEPDEAEKTRASLIAFAAKNGISLRWHTG